MQVMDVAFGMPLWLVNLVLGVVKSQCVGNPPPPPPLPPSLPQDLVLGAHDILISDGMEIECTIQHWSQNEMKIMKHHGCWQ